VARPSRHLRGRAALGGLALLTGSTSLALVAGGGAGAAAAGPHARLGAVKPDISYFAGKTITFEVGSKPGGSGDDYVRPIGPLIASYLHCSVNIVDNSSGADLAAQNAVATSTPDGLTIGELNIGSNYDNDVSNIPGLAFTMNKIDIIAGAAVGGSPTIVASPRSAIKNVNEFVDSRATSKILDVTPGGVDLDLRVFLGAYRVNSQLVLGYTSGSVLAAGFQRGDAPFAAQGVPALGTLIGAGLANPLVLFSTVPYPKGLAEYAQMKSVPTLKRYAASHPPTTRAGRVALDERLSVLATPAYGFFAPQNTPPKILAALTAAFHSALLQASTKAAYEAFALSPGYTPPTSWLRTSAPTRPTSRCSRSSSRSRASPSSPPSAARGDAADFDRAGTSTGQQFSTGQQGRDDDDGSARRHRRRGAHAP